ncbi:hypothetical protein ACN28E_10810 [Archangium lansingense]|uniref:hypothetical protein n=1 Tax=Archangium lansingense TaxID=2995310 RepID=UPI003B7B9B8E
MSAPMPQPLDALRRQLEGRWEHIEQARERYTQLTRQLGSFQWKRALRSQPELLKQTREHETELTEVLAYVEHRASREQWPKEHPGRRVLQELRALRAKLEALVHERLTQSLSQVGASFEEALGALEAVAAEPLPHLPGKDEPVLFEDWMLSWTSPGRVWLTPKRLLWQPWSGEPVQVPLGALERDAITLLPGWIGLHVKRVGLTLFSLSYADTLASLLRFGARVAIQWHEQPQVPDVVTSPAYLRHETHEAPKRWGLSVFGPHGLALLPVRHRALLDFCRNLVGLKLHRPPTQELQRLESLVEMLRRLPTHAFNQALWELTQARGGTFWPSTEFQRLENTALSVRLQAGKQLLVVDSSSGAVLQFLERHPPAQPSQQSKRHPLARFTQPLRNWWQDHNHQVAIAASMALFYVGAYTGPGPENASPLMPAGFALFAWTCMRYSKAKGHSVLPGLLASLLFPLFVCFPLVPLFLVFGSKSKQP